MVEDEILSEDSSGEEKPENERYVPIKPQSRGSSTKKIVLLLVTFIAIIVILLVVLMAFFQPGIVGKWHVTRMQYSIFSSEIDETFEFYPNGTGWVKNQGITEHFQWEFVGKDKVNLTFRSGGYLVISYKIDGDKITMKYLDTLGQEVTLYGKRVS